MAHDEHPPEHPRPASRWRRSLRGSTGILLVAGGITTSAAIGATAVASPAGAATACTAAGSTGLTAAVVATSGQSIADQTIDATGCDLGIYVPPTATGVTIDHDTVENAADHGILAQDTSDITVEDTTVEHNGFDQTAGIDSDKAVMFVGVSNSTITGNTVEDNGGGGITVADDGPTDPGAPNPGPSTPVAARDDTISDNTASDNYGGCGILLEAWNAGGGVTGTTISDNTIVNTPGTFGPEGPAVGQIVLAVDGPGSTLSNDQVTDNTVIGSAPAGIVLHANTPHAVISDIGISDNTLSANDWTGGDAAPTTTAIALIANPLPAPITPQVTGTTISGNDISNEYVAVWQQGATGTSVTGDTLQAVAVPDYVEPAPGTGYQMVGSDGGVFDFGTANYEGSLPGDGLVTPAPVVGLADTRDDGGYWIADANGDVYSFGDATFHGSLASKGERPTAPIVGIASTPVGPVGPTGNSSPNGLGYWLVGADGNVYAFGDATNYGTLVGTHLNGPIVALVPTPDGHGYWLVGADGGVFAFGDAGFYGSMGDVHLNAPIVGAAATPDGHGYWLVAADGGVFAFGDAGFYGSMGDVHLNAPVVGMVASPSGMGYTLMAADGGVFAFGDAGFYGSAATVHLARPIVGEAST
jgi:hypothetical protein